MQNPQPLNALFPLLFSPPGCLTPPAPPTPAPHLMSSSKSLKSGVLLRSSSTAMSLRGQGAGVRRQQAGRGRGG